MIRGWMPNSVNANANIRLGITGQIERRSRLLIAVGKSAIRRRSGSNSAATTNERGLMAAIGTDIFAVAMASPQRKRMLSGNGRVVDVPSAESLSLLPVRKGPTLTTTTGRRSFAVSSAWRVIRAWVDSRMTRSCFAELPVIWARA